MRITHTRLCAFAHRDCPQAPSPSCCPCAQLPWCSTIRSQSLLHLSFSSSSAPGPLLESAQASPRSPRLSAARATQLSQRPYTIAVLVSRSSDVVFVRCTMGGALERRFEEDFDELLALRAVMGTNATFLELGSGDGRNLLRAVRHGYAHAIGVEWSPLLVFLTRLLAWLAGESARVTVHRADMLSVPLPADDGRAILTIFLYLSDDLLTKLSSRLACDCQGRGQRVSILSRDFELPHWQPSRRLVRDRTILLAYDGDGAPPCTRGASSSAKVLG